VLHPTATYYKLYVGGRRHYKYMYLATYSLSAQILGDFVEHRFLVSEPNVAFFVSYNVSAFTISEFLCFSYIFRV
jgi:hypothetical protein